MTPIIVCRRLNPASRILTKGNPKVILVPHDIWLNVARFIPRKILVKMYSVNPSFFEIAMDALYREVELHGFDRGARKKLDHIKARLISKRVRSLHIRPWLVAQPPEAQYTWHSKLGIVVKRFIDPDYTRECANKLLQKRSQTEIKAVMDAVHILKRSVTEYFIDWDEQPDYHHPFYVSFLTPLLRQLEPNLQKLSLKIPVQNFRALFPSERSSQPAVLCNLQELELMLCTGMLPQKDIDESLDVLMLFIHNLSPTLQSLSISTTTSSAYLDLSRFFHHLGVFPRLRRLALSIPFDGAHLSNPSKLHRVLHDHRDTLRTLTLSTIRCSVNMNLHPTTFTSEWIQQSLATVHFADLRTLEVALRPLRGDLGTTIAYLRRFASTLTSLVLMDRTLTYGELEMVLGAFDHIPEDNKLEKLRLSVDILNPQMVDLLARKLPQLKELELMFRGLEGSARRSSRNTTEPEMFDAEMSERLYFEWDLHHLGLPKRHLEHLKGVFTSCIPEIRTFGELDG